MIENQFIQTCTIQRKKDSANYGGISADNYDIVYEKEPCLFIQTIGRTEKRGEAAISTVIDGYIRIGREIVSTDRLIINDYIYYIANVKEVRNLYTDEIEFWEGSATRVGKYTDESSELVIREYGG